MFVKEMGKKKPKGIKVGMTREEAFLLKEQLLDLNEEHPFLSGLPLGQLLLELEQVLQHG